MDTNNNFDPPELDGDMASALVAIIVDVILSLIFLLGTVSNSILLVVFYRRPVLRTLSNRFVMSLLVMNLIATCVFLPLIFLDNVAKSTEDTGDYNASVAMCSVGQAFASFVSTGSMIAALLIGIDQYFAVMDPLHYHRKITKNKAHAMMAGKWILSAVLAGLAVPDLAGKEMWKGCADSYDTENIISFDDVIFSSLTMLFVSISVLVFLLPLVTLVWVYMRIYNAAHKNSQRTRRNSMSFSTNELVIQGTATPLMGAPRPLSRVNSTVLTPQDISAASVSSAKLSRSPSLRSTSSQLVYNLKYRISNASLFLYREEARAVRISVSVIVTLLLCLLPYHVSLILNLVPSIQVPQYVNSFSFIAVLCNSLLSPFLYAYRSRRLQKELRRLFGLPVQANDSKKKRMRVVRRASPLATSDHYDEKKKDFNANKPIEMKQMNTDIIITVTSDDSRSSFSSGTTFPSSSMGDSDVSL